MLASRCEKVVEGISSMVRLTRPYCGWCNGEHVPNLVTLTLLEVVALSATGLEEVGALLGVTLNLLLVRGSFSGAIGGGGATATGVNTETSSRVPFFRRRQCRELRAVQGAAIECCSFVVRLVCFRVAGAVRYPDGEDLPGAKLSLPILKNM